MAEPATTGTVTAMGFVATAMTLMPWGVSLETLMLGGACYFVGSASRTGTIIGKALEAGTDPHIGRYVLALAFSIPTAAVASCLIFFAANVLHIQADVACGGILFLSGLKGNEGIQGIVSIVSGLFNKVFGGQK